MPYDWIWRYSPIYEWRENLCNYGSFDNLWCFRVYYHLHRFDIHKTLREKCGVPKEIKDYQLAYEKKRFK